MYRTILLAVALQQWERYSTHALAARDVAATLARGSPQPLHVLSVYAYETPTLSDSPTVMVARYREEMVQRTDDLIHRKIDDYIALCAISYTRSASAGEHSVKECDRQICDIVGV